MQQNAHNYKLVGQSADKQTNKTLKPMNTHCKNDQLLQQ